MNFSKVFLGLSTCFLAASLTGCFVQSAPPPPLDGSITVDVTIEESTSPVLCQALAVDRIEISLFDARGGVVDTVTTPCETFGITIDGLPEGTYDADVLLLDINGNVISDTVQFTGDVVGGTDLHVDVDFPAATIN